MASPIPSQASCGLKGSYISIPWTLLNAASSNSYPIKFHSIKANVSYRLWSPVYGGSLLRRTRPNNVVDCGGAFSNGMDYDSKYPIILMQKRMIYLLAYYI